jgi:hypothetical protein
MLSTGRLGKPSVTGDRQRHPRIGRRSASCVRTRVADLPSNGNGGKRHVADQCPVANARARRMVDLKTNRGGPMQPIDVRKLECLRRFRFLRAAYLGTPAETSSAHRRHGASGDDGADRGDSHCDPRA